MSKKLSLSVDELAERANDSATACRTNALKSLEKGIEAGAFLNQAKQEIPHGEFQDWLQKNFRYSARWAQQLMKAASNRGSIVGSSDSISELLRRIAEPDPPDRGTKAQCTALLNSTRNGGDRVTDSTTTDRPADSRNGRQQREDEPRQPTKEELAQNQRRVCESLIKQAVDAVDELHRIKPNGRFRSEAVRCLQDGGELLW